MGQAGVAVKRSKSPALSPAGGYDTAVLTWGAAAIRRGEGGGGSYQECGLRAGVIEGIMWSGNAKGCEIIRDGFIKTAGCEARRNDRGAPEGRPSPKPPRKGSWTIVRRRGGGKKAPGRERLWGRRQEARQSGNGTFSFPFFPSPSLPVLPQCTSRNTPRGKDADVTDRLAADGGYTRMS